MAKSKRRLSWDRIKHMFGGSKKPKPGINDDWDPNTLRAQISFYEKDIIASDQWIYNYEQDLKKWINNPRIADHIQQMIAAEKFAKEKAQERLEELKKELAEELAKEK